MFGGQEESHTHVDDSSQMLFQNNASASQRVCVRTYVLENSHHHSTHIARSCRKRVTAADQSTTTPPRPTHDDDDDDDNNTNTISEYVPQTTSKRHNAGNTAHVRFERNSSNPSPTYR